MALMNAERSLKQQMQIRFSLLTGLIFFLFISILTTYLAATLMRNTTSYTRKIVKSISGEVDLHLMRISDLLTVASNNPLFSNASERAKADYAWRALDFLYNLILDHPEIQDVILLNKVGYAVTGTGKVIHQDYNFYQQPWVYKKEGTVQKAYFLKPHNEDYYLHKGGEKEVISILFPLGNTGLPETEEAALLCNINTLELEKITRDLIPVHNSRILIYDQEGTPLFPSPYSGPAEYITSDRSVLTVEALSALTGWKLIASIPKIEVLKDIRDLVYIFVLALVSSLLITILTATRISMKISLPAETMAARMKEIGKGNFTLSLYDPRATSEIALLGKEIDTMISKITDYQERIRETQLFALQEQINPHFLFNTLQTIQSLTVKNRQKDIRRVTILLSEILRYSMYNPWEMVPLSSEFAFVEKYLEIQSYRFPGQFTYSIECSRDLEECKILKLLIQPLVENSINHGFTEMKNRHIALNVHREESGIVIIIADNGKGMDLQTLDRVRKKLHKAPDDRSSAIGLQNVQERMVLKFGRYYGLELQSDKNSGVTVLMHLPLNRDKENS